jgi:hypothetical protein
MTGLNSSVEIWMLSQSSFPSMFLFKFSLMLPAWRHLCFWVDSGANVTAYLDGQLVVDQVAVGTPSQAVVGHIWTNVEKFRSVSLIELLPRFPMVAGEILGVTGRQLGSQFVLPNSDRRNPPALT